ncbi:hypothetical protein CYMTET_10427 [Cymbomonas tetramitiformis]|uniref:Uncharacterized protein n=1 Tax=Cymbomonas tetramitiformis TaxID=36881 RepID=A0AAE0GPR4_9CHLO|nr:hypothetical protein CYMTET_10427 [Cymbomonas tetramitiformis]
MFGAGQDEQKARLRAERQAEYNRFLAEQQQRRGGRGGGEPQKGDEVYFHEHQEVAPRPFGKPVGQGDNLRHMYDGHDPRGASKAELEADRKRQYGMELERQIREKKERERSEKEEARVKSRELLQQQQQGGDFPLPLQHGPGPGAANWQQGQFQEVSPKGGGYGGPSQQPPLHQPPQQYPYQQGPGGFQAPLPRQDMQGGYMGGYPPQGDPYGGGHGGYGPLPGGLQSPPPQGLQGGGYGQQYGGNPISPHGQDHYYPQQPQVHQQQQPPYVAEPGGNHNRGQLQGMYGGGISPGQMQHNHHQKQNYAHALEQQIREKQERKERELQQRKKQDMLDDEAMAAYNPWGKGGAGAPLRDQKGAVVTDLSAMHHHNAAMQDGLQQGGQMQLQGNVHHGMPAPNQQAPQMPPQDPAGGGNLVGRFRSDNGMMTHHEVQQRQNAQREMQEALQQQIDERKRIKDAEKAAQKAEEARENERLQREQQQLEQAFLQERNDKQQKHKQMMQDAEQAAALAQAEKDRQRAEKERLDQLDAEPARGGGPPGVPHAHQPGSRERTPPSLRERQEAGGRAERVGWDDAQNAAGVAPRRPPSGDRDNPPPREGHSRRDRPGSGDGYRQSDVTKLREELHREQIGLREQMVKQGEDLLSLRERARQAELETEQARAELRGLREEVARRPPPMPAVDEYSAPDILEIPPVVDFSPPRSRGREQPHKRMPLDIRESLDLAEPSSPQRPMYQIKPPQTAMTNYSVDMGASMAGDSTFIPIANGPAHHLGSLPPEPRAKPPMRGLDAARRAEGSRPSSRPGSGRPPPAPSGPRPGSSGSNQGLDSRAMTPSTMNLDALLLRNENKVIPACAEPAVSLLWHPLPPGSRHTDCLFGFLPLFHSGSNVGLY